MCTGNSIYLSALLTIVLENGFIRRESTAFAPNSSPFSAENKRPFQLVRRKVGLLGGGSSSSRTWSKHKQKTWRQKRFYLNICECGFPVRGWLWGYVVYPPDCDYVAFCIPWLWLCRFCMSIDSDYVVSCIPLTDYVVFVSPWLWLCSFWLCGFCISLTMIMCFLQLLDCDYVVFLYPPDIFQQVDGVWDHEISQQPLAAFRNNRRLRVHVSRFQITTDGWNAAENTTTLNNLTTSKWLLCAANVL